MKPASTKGHIGGLLVLLAGVSHAEFTSESFDHFDSSLISSDDLHFYVIAFPKAYAEIFSSSGSGLSITTGNFYTITGTEGVTATPHFFYSRNCGFTRAGPFMHAGVLLGGSAARWYGINNFLAYDINSPLSAGFRAERFRDQDGVSDTQNVRNGPSGYHEMTAGLNRKPIGMDDRTGRKSDAIGPIKQGPLMPAIKETSSPSQRTL